MAIPFPIRSAEGLNLAPAEHWPEPVVQTGIDADDGPVVIMIEYRVAAAHLPVFRRAVDQLVRLRLRDGALRAGIFTDVADPARITVYPMAQDYDKIFREVPKDIFPGVAQKVLGIPPGQYQLLPVDLQYTSEREADQVWEITPAEGPPFVLHCEFRTTNDKQMLSRMLIYHAFLHCQKRMPIRQYVVYFGKDKLNMERRLDSDSLSYHYQLVDLRSFPYQTFLEASHSQEVLLAIIANFGGEPVALIAERILLKLQQLTQSKLQLEQRVLQLVRSAVLRNVNTTVFNVAQKRALNIDIKDDTLYQLGQEEGLQKGLQLGQEEGKEKAALNMLKEGFPQETVARLTELPPERVVQLELELDASHK